jgi:hypothetical protein
LKDLFIGFYTRENETLAKKSSIEEIEKHPEKVIFFLIIWALKNYFQAIKSNLDLIFFFMTLNCCK